MLLIVLIVFHLYNPLIKNNKVMYTKSIQIIPENLCLITDIDEELNQKVMSALSEAINKSEKEKTDEKITDNNN